MLSLPSSKAHVMGRGWFYDDGPYEIEIWEYALEPMSLKKRSGAEWCRCHLLDCVNDEYSLRELLVVPSEGNFQVIFKGFIEGYWQESMEHGPEWDEWFVVEESKCEPIPLDFLNQTEKVIE